MSIFCPNYLSKISLFLPIIVYNAFVFGKKSLKFAYFTIFSYLRIIV